MIEEVDGVNTFRRPRCLAVHECLQVSKVDFAGVLQEHGVLVAALAGLSLSILFSIEIDRDAEVVTFEALTRPDDVLVANCGKVPDGRTYQASLLVSQIHRLAGSPRADLTALECQIFLSKTRFV